MAANWTNQPKFSIAVWVLPPWATPPFSLVQIAWSSLWFQHRPTELRRRIAQQSIQSLPCLLEPESLLTQFSGCGHYRPAPTSPPIATFQFSSPLSHFCLHQSLSSAMWLPNSWGDCHLFYFPDLLPACPTRSHLSHNPPSSDNNGCHNEQWLSQFGKGLLLSPDLRGTPSVQRRCVWVFGFFFPRSLWDPSLDPRIQSLIHTVTISPLLNKRPQVPIRLI